MKKTVVVLILLVLLLTAFTSIVYAVQGGLPAAHGVGGRTFGEVTRGFATTDPLAHVEHMLYYLVP